VTAEALKFLGGIKPKSATPSSCTLGSKDSYTPPPTNNGSINDSTMGVTSPRPAKAFDPRSPVFSPTSPSHSPVSPSYSPVSPSYSRYQLPGSVSEPAQFCAAEAFRRLTSLKKERAEAAKVQRKISNEERKAFWEREGINDNTINTNTAGDNSVLHAPVAKKQRRVTPQLLTTTTEAPVLPSPAMAFQQALTDHAVSASASASNPNDGLAWCEPGDTDVVKPFRTGFLKDATALVVLAEKDMVAKAKAKKAKAKKEELRDADGNVIVKPLTPQGIYTAAKKDLASAEANERKVTKELARLEGLKLKNDCLLVDHKAWVERAKDTFVVQTKLKLDRENISASDLANDEPDKPKTVAFIAQPAATHELMDLDTLDEDAFALHLAKFKEAQKKRNAAKKAAKKLLTSGDISPPIRAATRGTKRSAEAQC
jgi:hypothetical protein